jgi:hypothetical protein
MITPLQHTTYNTQHTTHKTQNTKHNTQHTTHNTQHAIGQVTKRRRVVEDETLSLDALYAKSSLTHSPDSTAQSKEGEEMHPLHRCYFGTIFTISVWQPRYYLKINGKKEITVKEVKVLINS